MQEFRISIVAVIKANEGYSGVTEEGRGQTEENLMFPGGWVWWKQY